MRIAFATLYDPHDPGRGSGTFYFMSRELERQGHEVSYIGPVDYSTPPWSSRLLKRMAVFFGKRYRSFQDVFVARQIGARVSECLVDLQVDVLLTNDYSIAGFYQGSCPVAIYTDSVFPYRYRAVKHPWLGNLFAPNVLSCQHVTRRGLGRAMLWCFPSDWSVQTALGYQLPNGAAKVKRIEFGCNLPELPSAALARSRSFAAVRDRGHLRVLFVGNRDWRLKGGAVAVAAVRELRARGVDARLDLVGALPEGPLPEDWVRGHGVIDKATEHARLSALYQECDVLLVPTRAEGFGIVFVEAAAHGMPSLSYDSGTGVNNAIRHGESGLLLPMDNPPSAFADEIHAWYDDPSAYDALAHGGRVFHETVANWPEAIQRLVGALAERLAGRRAEAR